MTTIKRIPVTMIKLLPNQKMDTKQTVCDFRKGEWDAFATYSIHDDGSMSTMSAQSFEEEIIKWKNLTHHEKISCVNFVKSMNHKYGRKYHSYNVPMKKYAGFEV